MRGFLSRIGLWTAIGIVVLVCTWIVNAIGPAVGADPSARMLWGWVYAPAHALWAVLDANTLSRGITILMLTVFGFGLISSQRWKNREDRTGKVEAGIYHAAAFAQLMMILTLVSPRFAEFCTSYHGMQILGVVMTALALFFTIRGFGLGFWRAAYWVALVAAALNTGWQYTTGTVDYHRGRSGLERIDTMVASKAFEQKGLHPYTIGWTYQGVIPGWQMVRFADGEPVWLHNGDIVVVQRVAEVPMRVKVLKWDYKRHCGVDGIEVSGIAGTRTISQVADVKVRRQFVNSRLDATVFGLQGSVSPAIGGDVPTKGGTQQIGEEALFRVTGEGAFRLCLNVQNFETSWPVLSGAAELKITVISRTEPRPPAGIKTLTGMLR